MIESAAYSIESFRSLEGKRSEEEYQVSQLYEEWANPENLKLRTPTPAQETTDRKTEHEIRKRLTRVLLPGFQEELERLPGNLNLTVHTIGSSWWHEKGLWSLLEIDDVIREIDRSINTQHQIRLQFFEYLQDHFLSKVYPLLFTISLSQNYFWQFKIIQLLKDGRLFLNL
ncbi:hypothetical protein PSTT_00525 [Puccinia striiformis]|uniref:Uncharacterized protein n=1 Tax=Puccinia striiformis TaxID=27350 RepID=A0A2S4W646_9BASI|nr:hypothetical protein PSTT_00525 [Puccinia striiformis]